MINPIIPRQFEFDINKEISHPVPTNIVLLIFKENVSKLEFASDIFNMYRKMKLTCKFLHGYVSEDLVHYLNINNVNHAVVVRVFNEIVEKSFNRATFFDRIRRSLESELANRWKHLFSTNNIAELIKLIAMLPENRRWDHIAREKVIAQVIDKPYSWSRRSDHYIRLLSLECAKKDARITAQLFHKIPLIFLESGEEVGLECAKHDPCSTLEFIDEFAKGLVVRSNFGGFKTKHFDNVKRTAIQQFSKQAVPA